MLIKFPVCVFSGEVCITAHQSLVCGGGLEPMVNVSASSEWDDRHAAMHACLDNKPMGNIHIGSMAFTYVVTKKSPIFVNKASLNQEALIVWY